MTFACGTSDIEAAVRAARLRCPRCFSWKVLPQINTRRVSTPVGAPFPVTCALCRAYFVLEGPDAIALHGCLLTVKGFWARQAPSPCEWAFSACIAVGGVILIGASAAALSLEHVGVPLLVCRALCCVLAFAGGCCLGRCSVAWAWLGPKSAEERKDG